MNTSIKLISQPQDYFRELVVSALNTRQLLTQSEVEYYLVNLLFQFMKTDYLYSYDIHTGEAKDEPLVKLFQEALEEEQPQAQKALFRRLGDISLYQAGFFQESLNHKRIDIDYYIGMGERAYSFVVDLSGEELMKELYTELANKFSHFVDVLSEISEKIFHKTEKDILRTYEIWLKTKSEKAEKTLKQAGIIPSSDLKKNYQ